jgi:phosphatidate phosphatase LPIN
LALFEQSKLTFDELVENPDLILNAAPESIVVKVGGKLVPWPAALPQLLSTTFFKRPLPQHVYEKLTNQYVKKEDISPIKAGSPDTLALGSRVKDTVGAKRQGSSWFPWRRAHNSSTDTTQPISELSQQQAEPLNLSMRDESIAKTMADQNVTNIQEGSGTSSSDESEGGGGVEDKSGRSSRKDMHQVINIPGSAPPPPIPIGCEKYKKTLRLTSEQIKALGLNYGQNEAVFSVTTAYQGTSIARCHIYLWKHDDRVVVSDIDGTITKSDVLGHILPIIGNDWAQSGVAQLFTQIQDNGYKLLYLSARAIGQAAITREYLRSIKQGDVTLPDGPLLLNPTSLMSALHREVIEKKPEEFKIACLKDVSLLFNENPFYAGYGNKINDVWAYRAVGIPIPRIFTINHKGELRHALTNTFQSSYTSLVELAEHIFPVYKFESIQASSQIDGFNSFEYWRVPLPTVPLLDFQCKPIKM